ncbi:TauD/TfdA family dioxygenase [Nitrospirillum viridazoti]|uniref:TauD/TfdA-like domain-containing protein n=1 Tax=Nitrospirillum viridazoti CBAmc TaxID=1441467 RepID=A0A248K2U6_9PROT|nr:TauD/TfdA family dioxygenase [Nitrospirillum amazonense]ASG25170.1 hypothetical protein Y958_29855 [Nitrospirillum amazonense CBAmc]TWB28280.1 TfdA family taurine catabolism dioxygenase TauD [Nitrospirillum amazonense]
MLTHLEDLGLRIGDFALSPVPERERLCVQAALREFYGPDIRIERLVPPTTPVELRAALTVASPTLAATAEALCHILETDYSGIAVRQAGLAHLELEERAQVLFALAACMGRPTATDQVNRRVIWDVKVRQQKAATTFSEHADEADLHTDTQYFARPERYMMLYYIRPAACGGGISLVRDLQCLKRSLSATEEGRWAIDLLSRKVLPFRIPGVFTANGGTDTVEVTFATIFAERPGIRFRADTLMKGLALHPAADTPDVRRALDLLLTEARRPEALLQISMPADSIHFVNNHMALHGRTAFEDHERHVWRIRVDDDVPLSAYGGADAPKVGRAA